MVPFYDDALLRYFAIGTPKTWRSRGDAVRNDDKMGVTVGISEEKMVLCYLANYPAAADISSSVAAR